MNIENNKKSIVDLITDAVKNKDERVCKLFYEDSLFHAAYCLLRNIGEDNPELILDIIINVCELRRETYKLLQEAISRMEEGIKNGHD